MTPKTIISRDQALINNLSLQRDQANNAAVNFAADLDVAREEVAATKECAVELMAERDALEQQAASLRARVRELEDKYEPRVAAEPAAQPVT